MLLTIQTGNVVDELGFEAGYKALREAGFEAIDWNIDVVWNKESLERTEKLEDFCIFERSQEEIDAYFADELAEIHKNGLEITQAHAPFPCFLPGRRDVLEYAITCYKNMILFLDRVGCRHVVIHGITRQELMEETQEEIDALNLYLYESLIPTLQKTKQIKVCLVNLFTGLLKLARG